MKLEDIFLPTKDNDYTPHLLQRVAVVFMFIMVFLSFTAVNLQALFWTSSQWLLGSVLPAVVVDLTNIERSETKQSPLVRSAVLDKAARLKAEHMAQNGYFSHYSPDGVSPWHWFDEVSYAYAHAGENLAVHFKDSGAVVEAWMKSPTHRENIVSGKYTEIGVGTAKGIYDGHETVFVVQLFGTPAASIQPKPALAQKIVNADELVAKTIPPKEVDNVPIVVVEPDFRDDIKPASDVGTSSLPIVLSETTGVTSTKAVLLANNEQNIKAESEEMMLPPQDAQLLFYSYTATSSGLLPATVDVSTGGTTLAQAAVFGSYITSPSLVLQTIYLLVGGLVATLLLISIIIGIRNTRGMQVAYGIALLLIMSGLFYVQTIITTNVVIAASDVDAGLETNL